MLLSYQARQIKQMEKSGIQQPIKKEATDERRGMRDSGGSAKNRDSPEFPFLGGIKFPSKSSEFVGRRSQKS